MADIMHDAERVCETLLEHGGAASMAALREELPDALSNADDRKNVLDYCTRQGWIVRTSRRAELTAKGSERFGIRQLPRETVLKPEPDYVPPAAELDAVLSRLPVIYALFIRTVICTIIARSHLADTRNKPWPDFGAIGESGTGKTTMHVLICRLLGLDETAHVVNFTQAHTSGELRGLWGGPRYGFVPSHFMSLSYLAFDEVDKSPEKADIVDPYFLGEIRADTRGKRYRILPVPLFLCNPPENKDRHSLIRPAWRRRSFFLDMQFISPEDKEHIESFAAWLDSPGSLEPGLLRLEAFHVPERLSDSAVALLQSVRELLTSDYRNHDLWCGASSLELAALGHAALYRQSHEQAAWETGRAYLAVASTIPSQVVPGALKAWEALAQRAGDSAEELRKLAKAEARAQSARVPQLPAVIPPTPGELAMERLRFLACRDKMITNLTTGLKWFNPEIYPADTYEHAIAGQFGSEFRAFIAALGTLHNAEELAPYISLYNQMIAQAKPQVQVLKTWHEQQRSERVRADFRRAMVQLEREPGEIVTYKPPGDAEREEMLVILHGSAYSYGFVYEETGKGNIRIWSEDEPEEDTDNEASSPLAIMTAQNSRTSDTTIAGLLINGLAASRARSQSFGRCAYPANHLVKSRLLGWEPPAATVRIYGSQFQSTYSDKREYNMPEIRTCASEKCVSQAIAELPAPYYIREDLA